jgi:hypothetical protein
MDSPVVSGVMLVVYSGVENGQVLLVLAWSFEFNSPYRRLCRSCTGETC